MQFNVRSLDQPLGAVITGWDPGEKLSGKDRAKIAGLLQQHTVLVFRGNRQPEDIELVNFAKSFGGLVKGHEFFHDNGEYSGIHPEILPVNNVVDKDDIPQGTGGSMQLGWHADYSYVPTVGKESFLNAVELPGGGGPRTSFCSQYDALATLPSKMVEILRPLSAYHSITDFDGDEEEGGYGGGGVTRQIIADAAKKRERDKKLGIDVAKKPSIPTAVHPIIVRHPDTGRETLYVNPLITQYIVGMPRSESDDLLDELYAHSIKPEMVYSHDWEVGDTVVFDTLGSLHRRESWDPSQRRVMRQLSTSCIPT